MTAWSAETRQYIEEIQEEAYRDLAGSLGLGSDPMAAWERLTGGSTLEQKAPIGRMRAALGDTSTVSDEEWAQLYANLVADYERYASLPLPTRFEHPFHYPDMANTFDQVAARYRQAGRLQDPLPLVATLPSGNVHARIVVDPYGDSTVILFEQGLFGFFFHIARLIGWIAPPLSPEELGSDAALARMTHRYTMPPQASQYFAATMESYAAQASSWDIPAPQHNNLLSIVLLGMMQQFVMAHELGHVSMGHLGRKPERKDELIADTAGMAIVTAIARESSAAWAMGYWACDLTLVALNFLYRSIGILAFGGRRLRWTDETHPDPLERRELLKALAASEGSPEGVAAVQELIGMSEALLGNLWEFASAALLLGHNRGLRPAPAWNDLIQSTFSPQD